MEARTLTRDEMLALVDRIYRAAGSETQANADVELFIANCRHPSGSDLIFWPDQVPEFRDDHEPTVEEIVDIAMATAQVCPFCSICCSPGDLFCERCKTDLLAKAATIPKEKDAPEPALVVKPIRERHVTEHEALAIVQNALLVEGRDLDDFHLSVNRYDGGSLDAELTPWPDKGGWVVWVRHDWIVRGLIQSGGSAMYINQETGDMHWVRFP
jgi:hypothetical protein